MSITKKVLKSKPVCKATFKIGKELANGAKTAHVVGDFNEWNPTANEMKALKNGSFSATIDLESDKEYAFRYLLDGENWVNDEQADKYTTSEFGDSENCVIEAKA